MSVNWLIILALVLTIALSPVQATVPHPVSDTVAVNWNSSPNKKTGG